MKPTLSDSRAKIDISVPTWLYVDKDNHASTDNLTCLNSSMLIFAEASVANNNRSL